jgi:hypothetical protein
MQLPLKKPGLQIVIFGEYYTQPFEQQPVSNPV